MKKLRNVVEKYFKIDISTKTRKLEYVYARAIYFTLCYKFTNAKVVEIAKTLNMNHATILHSLKTFPYMLKHSSKLNTDYLNDLQSEWMEGLFNSPEVYILTGETTTDNAGLINKYLQPVILKTTSFTRKTVANDKLIQYTIDVERNKDLRTQTV